jgi:hypothetical protein
MRVSTTMSTVLPVAPRGEVTSNNPGLISLMGGTASLPPNFTLFTPTRFLPRILTGVPPAASPLSGSTNGGVEVAAAFRGGDLAAAFRGGDLTAAFRGGDLAVAFRGGDLAAAFRGGDLTAAFRGGDLAVAFRGGDLTAAFRGEDLAATRRADGEEAAAGVPGEPAFDPLFSSAIEFLLLFRRDHASCLVKLWLNRSERSENWLEARQSSAQASFTLY